MQELESMLVNDAASDEGAGTKEGAWMRKRRPW